MKKLIFYSKSKYPTRPEITEPELKISELDPKYKNTRTDSISLYRNTQKSKISDPDPNGYP